MPTWKSAITHRRISAALHSPLLRICKPTASISSRHIPFIRRSWFPASDARMRQPTATLATLPATSRCSLHCRRPIGKRKSIKWARPSARRSPRTPKRASFNTSTRITRPKLASADISNFAPAGIYSRVLTETHIQGSHPIVSHSRGVFNPFVVFFACLSIFLAASPRSTSAQQVNPDSYSAMHWREIGPYRAGRVTAVAGVPGNPAIYYIGTPGGGVWKTTDGGTVWNPIFDTAHVASIGAVTLAPSDTNIIYVGTGEQTQGNGVYKSTDAGATWKSIGLENTHFITGVIVDPKNPDIVIVAASGDTFSGADRGIFRSTDGGKTWQKTFYRDNDTSVMDINSDLRVPKMVYAT